MKTVIAIALAVVSYSAYSVNDDELLRRLADTSWTGGNIMGSDVHAWHERCRLNSPSFTDAYNLCQRIGADPKANTFACGRIRDAKIHKNCELIPKAEKPPQ